MAWHEYDNTSSCYQLSCKHVMSVKHDQCKPCFSGKRALELDHSGSPEHNLPWRWKVPQTLTSKFTLAQTAQQYFICHCGSLRLSFLNCFETTAPDKNIKHVDAYICRFILCYLRKRHLRLTMWYGCNWDHGIVHTSLCFEVKQLLLVLLIGLRWTSGVFEVKQLLLVVDASVSWLRRSHAKLTCSSAVLPQKQNLDHACRQASSHPSRHPTWLYATSNDCLRKTTSNKQWNITFQLFSFSLDNLTMFNVTRHQQSWQTHILIMYNVVCFHFSQQQISLSAIFVSALSNVVGIPIACIQSSSSAIFNLPSSVNDAHGRTSIASNCVCQECAVIVEVMDLNDHLQHNLCIRNVQNVQFSESWSSSIIPNAENCDKWDPFLVIRWDYCETWYWYSASASCHWPKYSCPVSPHRSCHRKSQHFMPCIVWMRWYRV